LAKSYARRVLAFERNNYKGSMAFRNLLFILTLTILAVFSHEIEHKIYKDLLSFLENRTYKLTKLSGSQYLQAVSESRYEAATLTIYSDGTCSNNVLNVMTIHLNICMPPDDLGHFTKFWETSNKLMFSKFSDNSCSTMVEGGGPYTYGDGNVCSPIDGHTNYKLAFVSVYAPPAIPGFLIQYVFIIKYFPMK
jgi:hypothetical protein